MAERVKAHRKRLTDAGWKQSSLWLPPQAVSRLSELSETWDLSRQEVVARLIMDADDQIPDAIAKRPAPTKKISKVKKKAVSKKKVTKKKRAARKKRSLELDAIGLERPVGYEDWAAAVSIRIDRGVNNANGEHVDWDYGMLRDSYMWDAEAEVEGFKKKHKKVTIKATYPRNHKRTIVYRAHYPDGIKDHRIVLSALPAKKRI